MLSCGFEMRWEDNFVLRYFIPSVLWSQKFFFVFVSEVLPKREAHPYIHCLLTKWLTAEVCVKSHSIIQA